MATINPWPTCKLPSSEAGIVCRSVWTHKTSYAIVKNLSQSPERIFSYKHDALEREFREHKGAG
jgi:hypothetical protein